MPADAPTPTQSSPIPASPTGPSYNITVPGVTATATTYFRLGAYDPSSPFEKTFFEGMNPADIHEDPGILLVSPGSIFQKWSNQTQVVTGLETLNVQQVDGWVRNATYSFDETYANRVVSFLRGHATGFTLADTQTCQTSASTNVGLSNAQAVTAGVTFNASLGVGVDLRYAPLAVSIAPSRFFVTTLAGTSDVKPKASLSAIEGITLAINPDATGVLAGQQGIGTTLGSIAAAVGVVAAAADATFAGFAFRPGETGGGSPATELDVIKLKEDLKNMRLSYLAVTGLITVLQAAATAYAAAVAAKQIVAAAIPVTGTPKISMTPSGITLTDGTVNTIAITKTGITLTSGLTVLDLGPATLDLTTSDINLSSTAGVTLAGIAVNVQAVATIGLKAPVVNNGP